MTTRFIPDAKPRWYWVTIHRWNGFTNEPPYWSGAVLAYTAADAKVQVEVAEIKNNSYLSVSTIAPYQAPKHNK